MNNNKNDMLGYEDFVKRSERYKGLPWSVLEKHSHALNDYANYCEQYKKKHVDSAEKIEQNESDIKIKSDIKAPSNDLKKKTHTEIMSDQMPVWRDTARAAPNSILRSALFGATKPGARQDMMEVDIPSIDNIKIKYTGERLDQSDLDVWCGIMHFARGKTGIISVTSNEMPDLPEYPTADDGNHESVLGKLQNGSIVVSFTSNEMLDLLGHSTVGGGNHESLLGKLKRLQHGSIIANIGNEVHVVSLIDKIIFGGMKKNYARKYTVKLDIGLLLFFAPNSWSAFDWSVRRKLGKKSLALWVHGFYSTHRTPWPYSVEKIYAICGSDASNLRQFKAELKKAIAVVCDAAGWDGFIDDNGNVHIIKSQKIAKDTQ